MQFLIDPRLWAVLLKSLLLSLLFLGGLWWGLSWLFAWLSARWPWWHGWMSWGTDGAAMVGAILLLPATFGVTLSFFQEAVADRVEEKHYPELGPADGAGFGASILSGLRFFVLMVVLNLAAAPLYLVLLLAAGSGAAAFLLVNGILCGREYFDIVALRRMTPEAAHAMRTRNRVPLALTGLGLVGLGLVPGLNLVMPVVGIAVMVHVVRSLAEGRR